MTNQCSNDEVLPTRFGFLASSFLRHGSPFPYWRVRPLARLSGFKNCHVRHRCSSSSALQRVVAGIGDPGWVARTDIRGSSGSPILATDGECISTCVGSNEYGLIGRFILSPPA